MARSRGVTIYGTYAVIVGGVNAVANFGLIFVAPQLGQGGAPPNPQGFLTGAVLGALLCASGIGAFLLKPWGRTLGIALAAINLALLLVGLLRPPALDPAKHAAYAVTTILLLAVHGGIVWFFTRPAVNAQFRPS